MRHITHITNLGSNKLPSNWNVSSISSKNRVGKLKIELKTDETQTSHL